MDTDKLILTDIDDVLWYLIEAWVKWLNKHYGLHVKLADCHDWDITLLFPMLEGAQIYAPLFDDEFWKTVVPREDAQFYIPKLQEAGYTVKLCSATHHKTAGFKIDLLLNYFPTIKDDDIILCSDKSLVRGKYLIDDKMSNLEGRECPILMTSWHNRDLEVKEPMIRVGGWREIYDYIMGEKSEFRFMGHCDLSNK